MLYIDSDDLKLIEINSKVNIFGFLFTGMTRDNKRIYLLEDYNNSKIIIK